MEYAKGKEIKGIEKKVRERGRKGQSSYRIVLPGSMLEKWKRNSEMGAVASRKEARK